MSLSLEKLSQDEWALLSSSVHKYSFGIDRPPDMDRIDFALLVKKDDELSGYATVIELDKDSVYMQHGGNFEASSGNVLTVRTYLMMVNYLKEHYKNISTRIYNKNKAMLKLAWAGGFTITGLESNRKGEIFLVLDLEGKANGG